MTFCKDKLATETIPITKTNDERGGYYYDAHFNYLNLIHYKVERYLRTYTSDLRSWDLRDERIIKTLNVKP